MNQPYDQLPADHQYVTLLVLQGSPFCNIDCSYCYLPDRTVTRRMSAHVLEKTLECLSEAQMFGPALDVLWHAGEPLAVPVSYYKKAIEVIRSFPQVYEVASYVFQTNAMLINQAWCDFFREHDCVLGVSIDGPESIHDHHRKNRQGKGTFQEVMRGVEKLQANELGFGVISVLSEVSLDHPEEMFDFFYGMGATGIGFNIEEIEGANRTTSLSAAGAEQRVREFFQRFYQRNRQHGFPLSVREFDDARDRIMSPGEYQNQETTPFSMINVDCDGNFTTFSPELLGQSSEKYGPFQFGNVLTDSIADARQNESFLKVAADVAAGNKKCEESCRYWSSCYGASPTNKYFENETFDSTETMHCRAVIQAPVDIIRNDISKHGQWSGPPRSGERTQVY